MQLVLLAEDCVKLLTNEQASNEVKNHLQKTIDLKKKKETERKTRVKTVMQKKLKKKLKGNKFLEMA